jgi:ADP-ribosyl-[dinitrogen reductase] hydrolase
MYMLENKLQGCLLGLACGDAVGASVEFLPRGRFKPLTDMLGGGKFQLKAGMWTDDTSMSLCLAESLIICKGFDADDQMQRYLRWIDEGYYSSKDYAVGLGKTIINSLFRYRKTGNPYSGRTESRYSGNGSLMRLAPIAIYYQNNLLEACKYASLSSQTTHASAECIQACQYFCHILLNAFIAENKYQVFESRTNLDLACLTSIVSCDFMKKSVDEIKGSGFVLESLEAALWAFWHTNNFKDAVLAAANLGDDADTTAAICGQLAGAYYGIDHIPVEWLRKLHRKNDIQNLVIKLTLSLLTRS